MERRRGRGSGRPELTCVGMAAAAYASAAPLKGWCSQPQWPNQGERELVVYWAKREG
jgi:hypothetical protein